MHNLSLMKEIRNYDQSEMNSGENFKYNKNINPTKLLPGDREICGRVGNNIIFGSMNGEGEHPYIKIRNFQGTKYDNERKLSQLNINQDGSSIYLLNNI